MATGRTRDIGGPEKKLVRLGDCEIKPPSVRRRTLRSDMEGV